MAPTLAAPLFLFAAAASAGAPPTGAVVSVRIEWEGPADCSDPVSFLAGVAARASQVRRAEGGEDAVRIEVHLVRSGGRVHGELRLPGEGGKTELRKVEGATCNEVADALSLTAALALDASVRRADAPTAARSSHLAAAPTSGPSGAPRPGPASPSGAAPPAPPPSPAVGGLPSTAPPLPAVSSPKAGEVPGPPLVTATAEGNPPPSSASSAGEGAGTVPPSSGLVPTVGLGAVAGDIVSPFLSVGAALTARLAWRRGGPLDPSLGISVMHLRDDLLGATPDVAVRWTAVSLEACPGWGLGGASASLELCAAGAGGWLSAAEQAVTVRRSASHSWWSVGASLRGRLALGWGGFALEIDATAHVPLVHRRFVTSTPEETVGESPAVGATLSVGVSRDL